MRQRTILVAALLSLAVGCGEKMPLTSGEQAAVYLRRGRYAEAIAAADKALRVEPNDALTYTTRARAYQFRGGPGDLDRAVADYSEAIRLAPDNYEAYRSRAMAYRDLNDFQKSNDDEAQARKLDPRVAFDNWRYEDAERKLNAQLDQSAEPDDSVIDAAGAPAPLPERRGEALGEIPRPPREKYNDTVVPGRAITDLIPGLRAPLPVPDTKSAPNMSDPRGAPPSAAQLAPGVDRLGAPLVNPWAQPPGIPGGRAADAAPQRSSLPAPPFPQLAPRPTGYVDPVVPGTSRGQPSGPYRNDLNSIPPIRPFE